MNQRHEYSIADHIEDEARQRPEEDEDDRRIREREVEVTADDDADYGDYDDSEYINEYIPRTKGDTDGKNPTRTA